MRFFDSEVKNLTFEGLISLAPPQEGFGRGKPNALQHLEEQQE